MTDESTIYVVYTDQPIKAFTDKRIAEEYSARIHGKVQTTGLRIEGSDK
ncbi:MAG: hypothetical protein LKJ39_12200 [Liquorilactobacillus nagelii]|jgi:hypothetical protein|nr:hypothetical protein [Liquorilactobacillus nagelii]MCI1978059.1 hypothetical protein [Liquorilactobacillus nagelii]